MPRILLLIPSSSYRAPDFMAAAQALDVQVVVGSDRRSPLEDLHPEKQLGLDFQNPDLGAEQIERYARRFPLDSIVAVDDAGIRLAARASRRLELPHNPVRAVEATRNKALLRERLADAGIPSPAWQVAPLDAEPAALAARLTFPVVVKPLSLSASRGVIRVDDEAALGAALERIGRILQQPECAQEAGLLRDHVLIEGYIPGIEVSLEGLLTRGRLQVLALFDKPDPLEGPFFEETIYVTPSRLPEQQQALISATTERAAAALGLQDGPLHAELRLNSQGAFPIDIAARSIGGLCSRTLSFGTGVSLEELVLRHAVGLGFDPDRSGGASGVMMIPIPKAGRLRAIAGIEEAEAVPLIQSVTMSLRPGDTLVPLPEGGEYLGFIFARGDQPDRVEAALREAHRRLHFDIEG